jgi:3-oxoacyl-[acyl-carrier-protein] synthase-3
MTKFGDTSDEWITTATGIKERRVLSQDETLQGLVDKAAERALEAAGVVPKEVDLCIVATIAGDTLVPSTSSNVKRALHMERAVNFDLNMACSGFMYALWTAQSLMLANNFATAVVIGAEQLSRMTDWGDRSTFVLFGDAAAGCVLKNDMAGSGVLDINAKRGIIASDIRSHYDDTLCLQVSGLTTPTPFVDGEDLPHVVKMNGRAVFKFATAIMQEHIESVTKKAGMTIDDIDYFIPHQANQRIVAHVAKVLGIPMEKMFLNVHKYGNTSAASVPLALDEFMRSGNARAGQNLLMVAFGGGLSSASCVVKV